MLLKVATLKFGKEMKKLENFYNAKKINACFTNDLSSIIKRIMKLKKITITQQM